MNRSGCVSKGNRERWPQAPADHAHPLAANGSREDRGLITGTVTRHLHGEKESDERLGQTSAGDSKWAALREGMEEQRLMGWRRDKLGRCEGGGERGAEC